MSRAALGIMFVSGVLLQLSSIAHAADDAILAIVNSNRPIYQRVLLLDEYLNTRPDDTRPASVADKTGRTWNFSRNQDFRRPDGKLKVFVSTSSKTGAQIIGTVLTPAIYHRATNSIKWHPNLLGVTYRGTRQISQRLWHIGPNGLNSRLRALGKPFTPIGKISREMG